MADESTAPMKPADTTIFLLGRIEGTLTSLQTSVDNNVQAQQLINRSNEEEHTRFRSDIGALSSAVAVLNDSNTTRRLTKYEVTQRWMVWLALPAAIGSIISQFFTK